MTDDVLDLSNDDVDEASTAGERSEEMTVEEAKEFNKSALDSRLDALRYSKKRIREADDDQLVFQQLEGNVIVEVKEDEREDVLEKLDRAIEELESQKEKVDEWK